MRTLVFTTLCMILLAAALPPAGFTQCSDAPLGVGFGLRAGLRDSTALVLAARVRIACIDPLEFCLRPTLLVAGGVEARASLTAGAPLGNRIRLYGGGGVAYNESGSGRVDPMLSAGVEVTLFRRLGIGLSIGHLLKEEGGDTELTIALLYSFGRRYGALSRQLP